MSLPTRSEQTAPSERRCRCLLLRWWCHCKFSASVADCGAILNRSVFPECLWLIWHFSLNPSRCLSSLQLYLSPSLSLYPSFHCSYSRLPLFKYLSSPFFFTHSVHRHFVSPFPHLFKHSSGEFQSTWALISPLRCKWMHSIPSTGSKITVEDCQSVSFCPHIAETVTPAPVFVVAPPGAVCFHLIKFGM